MSKKLLTIILAVVVIFQVTLFITTMPSETIEVTTSNKITEEQRKENRFQGMDTKEKENPELQTHNIIWLTVIASTVTLGVISLRFAYPQNDSYRDSD